MIKRRILSFIFLQLIVILLYSSVAISQNISTVMDEKEVKQYNFIGERLKVKVFSIFEENGYKSVIFQFNDTKLNKTIITSSILTEDDWYYFTKLNLSLYVKDIFLSDNTTLLNNSVQFGFFFCGDNICNAQETCEKDCGSNKTLSFHENLTETLKAGISKKLKIKELGDFNIVALLIEKTHNTTEAIIGINKSLITNRLTIKDWYILSENVSLFVDDLVLSQDGKNDTIRIGLFYCGDGFCNGYENCQTCEKDCGCINGETCGQIKGCEFCDVACQRSFNCGDAYCSDGETCEKDWCCFGKAVYDLEFDEDNCGRCGNVCNIKEKCVNGVCSGYCGDKVCNNGEDSNSCLDDCPILNETENNTEDLHEVSYLEDNPGIIEKFVSWIKGFFS